MNVLKFALRGTSILHPFFSDQCGATSGENSDLFLENSEQVSRLLS